MKYFYFLLLCLCIAPTTLLAQQTGSLTGMVSDANNGSPLPGANIGLLNLPTKGTATDINGLYTITDIPVGTHTVVVRYVGFREVQATVTIQANQATEQDFLMEEDFLNMEEIVVTGQGASIEKRRLSSDVSVLNSREIESAPVASIDELLQGRVTGATVRAQSAQPGQGMLAYHMRIPLLATGILFILPIVASRVKGVKQLLGNLFVLSGPIQIASVVVAAVVFANAILLIFDIIWETGPTRFGYENPEILTGWGSLFDAVPLLSGYKTYFYSVLLAAPLLLTTLNKTCLRLKRIWRLCCSG